MGPRARRLLVALVVGLAALGVTEVVLRTWWPLGGRTYRPDPELLHVPLPGSARLQLMPPGTDARRVLVTIGPDGYRGPGLVQPKARPRIAVIGDSFVLAANTPERDTFVRRLEGDLDGAFELVNAGAESYGPDQSILRLEREFEHLDPDLVLLVLCAHNDLGDPVRNKLFGLDSEGRLVRTSARIGPQLRAHFARRERDGERWALVRWLRHLQSPPPEVIVADPSRDWLAVYREAAVHQLADWRSSDRTVDDLQRDTYDADVALDPDGGAARTKARLLTALLERLGAGTRVPVAVLVVPSPIDVSPTYPIRPDPARHPSHDAGALVRTMTTAAAEAGLPCLDLTPTFLANDPGALFVGGLDIHWNARAQRLCAEAAAAWLRTEGLLPRP